MTETKCVAYKRYNFISPVDYVDKKNILLHFQLYIFVSWKQQREVKLCCVLFHWRHELAVFLMLTCLNQSGKKRFRTATKTTHAKLAVKISNKSNLWKIDELFFDKNPICGKYNEPWKYTTSIKTLDLSSCKTSSLHRKHTLLPKAS